MTRQKLKRFHVKRIYSTLLLSYGALLAAPFIAVFLLLSFWKNSTENYYSEIMKNDLTEGRMAFEKQLDIMMPVSTGKKKSKKISSGQMGLSDLFTFQ